MRFNRLLCLVTGPLLLASISATKADWNSTISAENPVQWFTFEDPLGSAMANDSGSANIDGTYVGGVVLQTPGLVGSAVTLDGVTGHILVGAPNLLSDWTVESILRADTVNGGVSQGILGADFTAATRMALKAEQWNETGQLGYTLFGVIDVTFADPAAATPADYTHVTFVKTSAGIELFINGVSAGSDPVASELSRHVLGAGAIRADGSLIDPLTGSIDELVIYDRALSASDVYAHFAAVPEPSTVGLLLLGILGLTVCRGQRRIGR